MRYIIPKQIELKTTKNEDLRKFCVMPLRAFLNPKISPYALRVLGVLASYCNRGGFSFVSMKTIAKDLGCTHQNIHKHLKNLEKFGIIETYSNYFPKLKGNTRRIIFDETIKREDLKEHDLHNSEITEILKTNKLLNEVNEDVYQLHTVAQSENTESHDIASLFSTITKESDLILAERLLSQGIAPGEVSRLLSQGN
jgi:DNA-binding MarR family transcriptional regulator